MSPKKGVFRDSCSKFAPWLRITPLRTPLKPSILFVGHSPHLAGAEYSVLRLIRNLPAEFDERVLAPGGGGFEEAIRRLEIPFAAFDPLPALRSKHDGRRHAALFAERLQKNFAALSAKIEKPDLVHSNTFHVFEGALLAAHWGVPHLWNLREILAASPSWQPFLSYETWCRLMGSLSDALVCNSEALAGSLPDAVRPLVRTIHNGLNPGDIATRAAARADYRARFGIPETARVVLTTGNFIPEKGHRAFLPYLPTLLREFPDLYFLWPGAHHLTYREVRGVLDREGITRVIAPGHIEGFGYWMAGADLYLLLSETEAFPTVVLESLVAGVPVLARDCGGVREILNKGGGKLVPLGDLALLAQNLRAFLRGELRLQGNLPEGFSEEEMARRYAELYRQLLRQGCRNADERRALLEDFRQGAAALEPAARELRYLETLRRHPVARRVLRVLERLGVIARE